MRPSRGAGRRFWTCPPVSVGALRSGTNRPKGRTKDQLYAEAKRRNIKGRSSMTKSQLERALS